MLDGYQKIYNFDNGYGASVVSSAFSYGGRKGLFEIAVLDSDGNITYDTPITDSVIGWLNNDELAKVLLDIKNLPKKNISV
jgi:hypothetical protein